MHKHARRPRTGRFLIALFGVGLGLAAASPAQAVTNDINDFNLTDTYWSSAGSYSATSGSGVQYRWLDVPSKQTQIAATNCTNGAWYGSAYFPAGSSGTSYRYIGYPSSGACFVLFGQTVPGSGSMMYYDGRLSR